MSEASEQRHEATLRRRIIKNTNDLIVNTLKLKDRDGDGRLSAEEGASLISVSVVETTKPQDAPTTKQNTARMQTLPYRDMTESPTISDDSIVFDRDTLVTSLNEEYKLTPERMGSLISKAFPNGVVPVTMGTMCTINPDLNCLPLPNGKIVTFNGPSVSS